jgi:toxin ParE1/3/4
MAYAVALTEDAERDLEDIYRYIAGSDSVANADRVLDALEAAALTLVELPERGNVPKELRSLGLKEYRELHWKPYRLIYRIDDRRVIVYCVADGRRDMQTLLQRRLLLDR